CSKAPLAGLQAVWGGVQPIFVLVHALLVVVLCVRPSSVLTLAGVLALSCVVQRVLLRPSAGPPASSCVLLRRPVASAVRRPAGPVAVRRPPSAVRRPPSAVRRFGDFFY